MGAEIFDPDIYRNASSRKLKKPCGEEQPYDGLLFTPPILFFYDTDPGDTSEVIPFTISNTGGNPIGIDSITVTGDFEIVGNVPTHLAPNTAAQVQIRFVPTAEGVRTGDVILTAGDGETEKPCVHLIGIGGDGFTSAEIEALKAALLALGNLVGTLQTRIHELEEAFEGEVGTIPLFGWVAYANSPDGMIDFTTGAAGNRSFIGMAFNKTTETPSQNPRDYNWSNIRSVLGNLVSHDTLNVGGRPASMLLSDLSNLSASLLAYEFAGQKLLDYVNGLLYVDGKPVNTVIGDFQNIVETGDTALAQKLSLIGSVTPDGLAFIVDLDSTFVSPTMSLGSRLTNIVTMAQDAQASVQNLEEAVSSAGYASAMDLSLLGAKTLDGQAWVLDMLTVRVSPTESLSQYINTQVAEAAGEMASVQQLYEAVVTPDGGASAKAMVQLNANGHVVGYSATNSNNYGQMIFSFDSVRINDPFGNSLFIAEGGVVKMPNVEIDRLKVGSVTSIAMAPNSATKKVRWDAVWGGGISSTSLGNPNYGQWNDFGEGVNKARVATPVLPAGSEVAVTMYVNMRRTGSSNDVVAFNVYRRNPDNSKTYFDNSFQAGMLNVPNMTSFEWVDYPPAGGPYTYCLEYYRVEGGGTFYLAKLIADVGLR